MALIHIGGKSYELIHENRSGWNPEAFRDRYSEVLERYDFIVGDWGYNQLRLKGFFRDANLKAAKDSVFSAMPDYINEYCNFGCAYFILEKKQASRKEPEDYDLDMDEELPRIEGGDLRAAAEAAYSEVDGADDGEQQDEEMISTNVPVLNNRQRSSIQRGDHPSRQSNKTGRRDNPQRKGYRGNEHRGKRPMKLAAKEAAAAAEPAKKIQNGADQ